LLYINYNISSSQRKSYLKQHVDYNIEVDVDEKNYQYIGKMELLYTNNSGQELNTVYFHLYFNAFQPNSAMDYRLQNIEDPDNRMMTAQKGRKKKIRGI